MTHKIVFNYSDDEHMTIALDGEVIGYFNHDQHGWSGMSDAKELASTLADKLGIETETTYETDDDID